MDLPFDFKVMAFANNLIDVLLDATPWLLFGLFLAGLIKAWLPQDGIAKWMGGTGIRPVFNAAVIGMPLPVCSCGVLPLAVGLRRGGASRPATTSFLVSTPETGVDSIALSLSMLGPFVAIARLVAALFSAFTTGMLMNLLPPEDEPAANPEAAAGSCSSCCGSSAKIVDPIVEAKETFLGKTRDGLRYAFIDIFNDIAVWLAVGLILAAATLTWIPPQTLGDAGGNLVTMVVMVLVGIPMYICATASTPVAAALMVAGVSPGAAMVFMLAGPATNIATLGVVKQEMGSKAVVLYLIGIITTALLAGLATDAVAAAMGFDVAVQVAAEAELLPFWLQIISAVIFLILALKPLTGVARDILSRFAKMFGATPASS